MNRNPKYFYIAYIETWCKYDMIYNIICETFNSYIRKLREKPLIDMLDYIRENLMEMMEKQVGQRNICPRIRKKLEGIRNQTRHCIVKHVIRERFQMTMFREQFTVDLNVVVDGGLLRVNSLV